MALPWMVWCPWTCLADADETAGVKIIDQGRMVHLRVEGEPEWSSFAEQPQSHQLKCEFDAPANPQPWTLSLRQQDVKQSWDVVINDQRIGRLVRDENDLRTDFEIPTGVLKDGVNQLQISQTGSPDPDDILVGEIQLHPISPTELRRGAMLEVVITDQHEQPLPGRITVVDAAGTLMPVGAESAAGLAVREGVVYTASGSATFGLQPGRYRIHAGRGFEYSVESAEVALQAGERAKRTLRLARQVDTTGWVACDTHVHTVTHSGHGDCTIEERMVTLAGEGIELPIATDHNKQIDYAETSRAVGTSDWFTPVIGNEVTTKQGHFNIFPTRADADLPNHEAPDWKSLFDSIFSQPQVRVAILNHARDLHSSFRPFSPRHHLSLAGMNLDGFDRRFNAMELINSGAVQTDPMQLFGDWCGLINHGMQVTPVGSSDSHDVTRYIVGQGRTYIACQDEVPNAISTEDAVSAFLAGKVVVSYGLLAMLNVNGTTGPGELVSLGDSQDLEITAQVLGPAWTDVKQVELWVNGRPHRRQSISRKQKRRSKQNPNSDPSSAGLQIEVSWTIPRSDLSHDAWLSLVATGPGVTAPYWPCAKPYQPDSIDFTPYVFSSTGPVWIDVDGDGQYQSPATSAHQIVQASGAATDRDLPDWQTLGDQLKNADPAVVHQVLAILRDRSIDPQPLFDQVDPPQRRAVSQFEQAWRESVRARLDQIE